MSYVQRCLQTVKKHDARRLTEKQVGDLRVIEEQLASAQNELEAVTHRIWCSKKARLLAK